MRTETKTIKIYDFDELSKDIQENLIEKEKEYQLDAYCECFLLEDMQEEAKRLLQKYFGDKATFKKVYYDLSYRQGSGAMIEFDLTYYNIYIKVRQYGHYYHECSFDLDWWGYLGDYRRNKLKEKIIKMNLELKKIGYDLIDEPYTDEDVIDILKENEYTEGGEIY